MNSSSSTVPCLRKATQPPSGAGVKTAVKVMSTAYPPTSACQFRHQYFAASCFRSRVREKTPRQRAHVRLCPRLPPHPEILFVGCESQFLHPRRPNLLAFSRGFFPAVSGRRVKRDAAPNHRSFPLRYNIVNVVGLSRVAGVNSCYSALSPGKSPSALPHPPFTCAPPAPPRPNPVPIP